MSNRKGDEFFTWGIFFKKIASGNRSDMRRMMARKYIGPA